MRHAVIGIGSDWNHWIGIGIGIYKYMRACVNESVFCCAIVEMEWNGRIMDDTIIVLYCILEPWRGNCAAGLSYMASYSNDASRRVSHKLINMWCWQGVLGREERIMRVILFLLLCIINLTNEGRQIGEGEDDKKQGNH